VASKQAMTTKLEHARKMLQKNLTKLKRAETIAKKWRTKVRYYEKKVDTSTLTNAVKSAKV
jgi:hypothetical protein